MAVLRGYNNTHLSHFLAIRDDDSSPQVPADYQANVPWYSQGWTTLSIALLFTFVGVSAICFVSWLAEGVIDWKGNWLCDRPDQPPRTPTDNQHNVEYPRVNESGDRRERAAGYGRLDHFRHANMQPVAPAPWVAETVVDYSDDENTIEPFDRETPGSAAVPIMFPNVPFFAPARLHMTYTWIDTMEREHLRALAGEEGRHPRRAHARQRGLHSLAQLRRELMAFEAVRMGAAPVVMVHGAGEYQGRVLPWGTQEETVD